MKSSPLPVAKKNSASFSSFIQLLMATAPQDRPVVLVMDNASYHHSQASEALLAFLKHVRQSSGCPLTVRT
ncbi:MAG: transposase [Anaerolineaceae bacterium]|nr:transposase [Anaerolineaceae bacterium]